MSDRDQINRRDFIVTTAGVAGGASALAGGAIAPALGQTTPPLPSGIDEHSPLAQYWEKPVAELVGRVDLKAHVPELSNESVKERHRIYCSLLMALIQRFWNGNKRGPRGVYPYRVDQKVPGQDPQAKFFRYRGDMIKDEDQFRVNWDRYLGHNIACIAVDGNGEVIDFDFNHNDFFRSSTEHAESRMDRRRFSLADVFDNWRTGDPIPGKSRAFSLQDVTLYTSLESCAQCSGVMSLGRVRQVVYLQYDPGTYRVGNIMFNLAGRDPADQSTLSPIPIAASAIDLRQFNDLNESYQKFKKTILDAKNQNNLDRAFFIPPDGGPADFAPSITSFLCTDDAFAIFSAGADELKNMELKFPAERNPTKQLSWTNQQCLDHARRFFDYADVEGFRGSPHKL